MEDDRYELARSRQGSDQNVEAHVEKLTALSNEQMENFRELNRSRHGDGGDDL